MSKPVFYKYLLGLSIGLCLILSLQSLIPVFKEHQYFSWVSLAFFILFTLGVYFLAEKAAYSPNINTFSSVIVGAISLKMVFIIFIVLIYKKAMNPESAWFLLPFFLIYLVFTIFEVYFMNILGRIKPTTKTKDSEVQSTSK